MAKKKRSTKRAPQKHTDKESEESESGEYVSKNKLFDRIAIIASLLIIGVVPGLLHFSTEAIYNYDLNVLYVRLSSMMRYITFLEYPAINPDLHLGEVNAYYPFTFILSAIFTALTDNMFSSMSLTAVAMSLLSTLVFYKICRYENIDVRTSMVLTFVYSFMLFHLSSLLGSLSWAGAFIFVPPTLYFLYKVFNERNIKNEIFLISSATFLIITTFAPMLYIFYFFVIYLAYVFLCDHDVDIWGGVPRLVIPSIFIVGVSSFYSLFLLSASNTIAWNKILIYTSFSPSRGFFINSGINPLSLIHPIGGNFTALGVVPIILFCLSLYVKKQQRTIAYGFNGYLLVMLILALFASIFPVVFAYLPFVGHTEYGWRALVIGAFSMALLSKDGIIYLKKRIPYFLLFLVIISGMLTQLYFIPTATGYTPPPYSDDIEDFYTLIPPEGVVRVTYHVGIDYPLCKNCIRLGAPENYYGIVSDERTTQLWGYIDYAQRNPTDPNMSGLLGEKYYITKKDSIDQYIQNGYVLVKNGTLLSLLENPYSTSIFQFIMENESINPEVQRKGSWFYTKFNAPSNGMRLIKFVYHPLAEVFDNGEKLEIKENDYGIMYAELNSGTHDVKFHYRTYWYGYISIASLAALIIYYRRRFLVDKEGKKIKKGQR